MEEVQAVKDLDKVKLISYLLIRTTLQQANGRCVEYWFKPGIADI